MPGFFLSSLSFRLALLAELGRAADAAPARVSPASLTDGEAAVGRRLLSVWERLERGGGDIQDIRTQMNLLGVEADDGTRRDGLAKDGQLVKAAGI